MVLKILRTPGYCKKYCIYLIPREGFFCYLTWGRGKPLILEWSTRWWGWSWSWGCCLTPAASSQSQASEPTAPAPFPYLPPSSLCLPPPPPHPLTLAPALAGEGGRAGRGQRLQREGHEGSGAGDWGCRCRQGQGGVGNRRCGGAEARRGEAAVGKLLTPLIAFILPTTRLPHRLNPSTALPATMVMEINLFSNN